ncbi:hypothetical protein FCL47_14545 [Desulfopila sp. IMCC35006]|uniref:hypothetical protein n=1 Tax=Desulfopila sp. IMCC35006 TaxID=2569542 RepID=UPI0010ABA2BC|nr:hypothetical protein [Desulfopila sp. IMCC35006]TKB25273.1 hypothetical protein FCL47_14545 [Desulfopila sp. IMCC35006]
MAYEVALPTKNIFSDYFLCAKENFDIPFIELIEYDAVPLWGARHRKFYSGMGQWQTNSDQK